MDENEQDLQIQKFIDEYLQTYSIETAAIAAGFPKRDAMTIGINLLADKAVQERLKAREQDFNLVAQSNRLTKERLLNAMMFQYNKANRYGKIKEAADILERMAKWCGVDPDNIKTDPVVIQINNLDESKI